jgi:hypothetical protein
MLCAAAGLVVRELPARDGLAKGILVAGAAIADELLDLVA